MRTIIDFLNPRSFFERLSLVIRNYRNLSFYKKTMRALDKNGSLKQYGMRLDKRSRAYYVLNLEPEILMLGAEVLELEKSRVFESIGKKKVVLEEAGLTEIIEARTERIKTEDYYAYLIQIKYLPIAGLTEIFLCGVWIAAAGLIAWAASLIATNWADLADSVLILLNQK